MASNDFESKFYAETDQTLGTVGAADISEPATASGEFMSAIQAAERSFADEFEDEYGVRPPRNIASLLYTYSPDEKRKISRIADIVYPQLDDEVKIVASVDQDEKIAAVNTIAIRMRDEVFGSQTPSDMAQQLTLSQGTAGRLINIENASDANVHRRKDELDCILSSLAVYAMSLSGQRPHEPFDYISARKILIDRKFQQGDAYNMPLLLNMLAGVNPHVQVLTRTTVGMGLPEIEDKIIRRAIAYSPHIRIGVSLLVGTHTTNKYGDRQLSNHTYLVSGVSDDQLLVYGDVPGEPVNIQYDTDFAERWFRANMLATTIIADFSQAEQA